MARPPLAADLPRKRGAEIEALIAKARHLTVTRSATEIVLTDAKRPGWKTGLAVNSILDGEISAEKFDGIAARLAPPVPAPRPDPKGGRVA